MTKERGSPVAATGQDAQTSLEFDGPSVQKSETVQSKQPTLRTGQRIILQNLINSRELNGHRGVLIRWKADTGRYMVRVAGKQMAVRPENLSPEGGAAEAAKFERRHENTKGSMYNPVAYAHMPGAGPKITQWIGHAKAGTQSVVRADSASDLDPVPLWFGDAGFTDAAPVDVALRIPDIGPDHSVWPRALGRVLQRFPVAAGRLRMCPKGAQIVCNNAGVPFTDASVPPFALPSGEELQRVCMDDCCALRLFDQGECDNVNEVAAHMPDTPMLRMKLTREEGTSRVGVLGVSFHHVLCDMVGMSNFLRWLYWEVQNATSVPAAMPKEPLHERNLAQSLFDSVSSQDLEPAKANRYEELWPLASRALQRWCFLARRLRSGLRGRPDGAGTVSFLVPAETISTIKSDVQTEGLSAPSSFEVLASYIGLRLNELGRASRQVTLTKEYRDALTSASSDPNFDRLFANVVTHAVSLQLPRNGETDHMPLLDACQHIRQSIADVDLDYVRWQSQQDHHRGLPNFFGGLCCNSWGRALADLDFVETYAVGMRSVDERAAKMVFPLDTAYMHILPLKSGTHRVLVTMPMSDLKALLNDLPREYFELPHSCEIRTHAFRAPLAPSVADGLSPAVETRHHFVRVACIGDSITACGYPKYLQDLFDRCGLKTQVRNFGVPGATAQKQSDLPYWSERRYEDAMEWRPHLIVATFGTNDAKHGNWNNQSFADDYADMCNKFLERVAPRPVMYLVLPPPVYKDGTFGIQPSIVATEVRPLVCQAAKQAERRINEPLQAQALRTRVPVQDEFAARVFSVDAFSLFGGNAMRKRCYFGDDGVHFNERGTKAFAALVFSEIRLNVARCLRCLSKIPSVVPDNPLGL